ncbi:MAG: propanediol dehydratase [Clostridiaceae bacterium]|jgi:hypothetical protein|nr:propanediol dehydratase [Clostridiaceae bacterium]
MEYLGSKPCIYVVADNIDNALFKNILAGIEEEDLPYEIFNLNKKDLVSTTHKASQQSKLGVAIGFSNNRVIVHYSKLKENNAIIDTSLKDYEITKARKIGNNAARLYKVMPFKDINSPDLDSLVESIKLKIIEVLKKHD